jgi:cytochrome c oxidase cbb3-type subunit III
MSLRGINLLADMLSCGLPRWQRSLSKTLNTEKPITSARPANFALIASRFSFADALWMFLVILLASTLFSACEREQRKFTDIAPSSSRPAPVRQTELQPGAPGTPSAEVTPVTLPAKSGEGPFDENAWAVSEGKRLFTWYNCVGCHANGGGGMGPPLMDDKWIYGSSPQQIHATIVEGRPNGMPSFGGKIPDQQVWQIVAYVRSLSGQLRKDVRSTRNDHMSVHPSDQARRPEEPKSTGEPQ